MDIGGKMLSNFLKELISHGTVNLTDELLAVEFLKRDVCYVSMDIEKDLKELALLEEQGLLPHRKRMPATTYKALELRFTRRYVLPDFVDVKRGYLIDVENPPDNIAHLQKQTLTLRKECFIVPEVIFTPSFLNIQHTGLAGVIEAVVELCPVETRQLFRRNIVVTGGCSLLPNFCQRLSKELGSEYEVKQTHAINSAWLGGKLKSENKCV
jgi:actin-related protein 6